MTLRANHPAVHAWHRLLRFQRSATLRLAEDLDGHTPTTLDEYDVLFQLSHAGGSTRMTDLSDAIVVARSSCTRIVDRLVHHGLVTRSADPTDRRVVLVSLTAEGRAALRRSAAIHLNGIEAVFASQLDDKDLADLARILDRLESVPAH